MDNSAVQIRRDGQSVDPLEYLARLSPAGLSIAVAERRKATTKMLHAAGRQQHVQKRVGLVGSELGSILKGLRGGPARVANYRSSYALDDLKELESSLLIEALAMADKLQWRYKKSTAVIRLCCALAISEKYFNVCKVCNGSSLKKDRKPCKSCDGGFSKRSLRECGEFMKMDHKNYARTWKSRVELLINVLGEWEDLARKNIAFNVRESS